MEYLLALATIAVSGLVVYNVFLPIFLKWLAQENILVTTCKEGTAKAIMDGGSFNHFIMSFAGYHLNDPRKKDSEKKDLYKRTFKNGAEEERIPDWEVLYHGEGNKKGFEETRDDYYDERSPYLKKLGLFWVGWPWSNKNVYVYQFEWNETRTDKDGKERVLPRAEASDFIYLADFMYAVQTIGAETADRLPTDELTQITIAVRNPYRALFSGEDWMHRITAAINRHVRNFVGNREYQQLISPGKSPSDGGSPRNADDVAKYWSEFSGPIIELNMKLPDDKPKDMPKGLRGRYGVEIRTADLQTMDLSGDGKAQHMEAATAKYIATQKAATIELEGAARGNVIEILGEKEASALAKRLSVIKEYGEAGLALAGYDAVQESSKGPGNTIIWANNPIPALAKALNPETKGDSK